MRKGGGGGEGKFLRADSKGKKGQENKGRTGKSFPLTYLPHPRISAMKDKMEWINGNQIQIIVETYT